jgi:hypothetical protein
MSRKAYTAYSRYQKALIYREMTTPSSGESWEACRTPRKKAVCNKTTLRDLLAILRDLLAIFIYYSKLEQLQIWDDIILYAWSQIVTSYYM